MPNFKIGDLVKRDPRAEFRNDVQLSSYDDKGRNISLLGSYLFTASSPTGTDSSAKILNTLTQAFLSNRLENRFVVIASYGHGKSHLALAIANYFGRPYQPEDKESPVNIVLDKLHKAYNGQSASKHFEQFKESRGEFIVVRLRGDVAGSLREQFLKNLEIALREHNAAKNARLPGWYEKAETFLVKLEGERLTRANAFLKSHDADVPLLIEYVQQKQDNAYDLFKKLYAHIDDHGFMPDMGGELSLADAVRWAVDQYCGEDKPLGGLLVLFDEFSLYVTNYAQRSASGDLQDLLNGISDRQGKAAFMAFAQQDPVTVAQNAGTSGAQRDSLVKELNRIPTKMTLHSLMESVIDSYLEQPQENWQQFMQDREASRIISTATNIAMDHFESRYQNLGWTTIAEFEKHVSHGCFPLHPITTALLCSVQFQQSVESSGTPRSILGFILNELDEKQEQPAMLGKRVNWVLPIYLVDYFAERLPTEKYLAYVQASERIHVDDEDSAAFSEDEQKDCLKALLLQEIAGIRAREEDQIDLLASMVGMPPAETKKCLRTLSDGQVIGWNTDGRKTYQLWQSSYNPLKLQQILDNKLSNLSLSWPDLLDFSQKELKSTPVQVDWGNADDWEAVEYIVPSEYFTETHLKEIIRRFRIDTRQQLIEGKRGYILWVIANTEDDVNHMRENAQEILDKAVPGSEPVPVLVILPNQPNSSVLDYLLKKKALNSFTPSDIDECRKDVYNQRLSQEELNLLNSVKALRGGETYHSTRRFPTSLRVPAAYKAHIEQLSNLNLRYALEELYKIAYRFSPSDFFPQYGLSKTTFNRQARTIARDLFHNDSASLTGTLRDSMANDIAKTLRQKWQILAGDNRIMAPPTDARLHYAWNTLDSAFPPGDNEQAIREILLKLLNPPYGYDHVTLTLLFCAWFGFNSHDLLLSNSAQPIKRDAVNEYLNKGTKDFVAYLLTPGIMIARRDVNQTNQQVRTALTQVRKGGLSKSMAEQISALMEDFVQSGNDSALIDESQQTLVNLGQAFKKTEIYEKEARKITNAIERRETNIHTLSSLLIDTLGGMATDSLIVPESPSVADLRDQLKAWIKEAVLQTCAKYETVSEISQVGLHRNELEKLRAELSRNNLDASLVDRVEQAFENLTRNEQTLKERKEEDAVQSEMALMSPSANLIDLQAYEAKLQTISNYSEKTMQIRDAQLTKIQSEIKKLTGFIEKATSELAELDSRPAYQAWLTQLIVVQPRLKGSEIESEMENLRVYGEQIGAFFAELDQARSASLRSEEDIAKAKKHIQALNSQFSSIVSDRQTGLILAATNHIQEYQELQEQQAIQFLEMLEAEFNKNANPAEIKEKLDKPIAFLPSSAITQLERLRAQVNQRLEENIIEIIEFQFKKIQSPELRAACLQRLQKIVKD